MNDNAENSISNEDQNSSLIIRSAGFQDSPDIDELPSCDFHSAFSPNTSPISSISSDDEMFRDTDFQNLSNRKTDSNCKIKLDFEDSSFVSLTELDAILNTPPSAKSQKQLKHQTTQSLQLETIFEGRFLETPPKKVPCSAHRRSINLMETFKENVQNNM